MASKEGPSSSGDRKAPPRVKARQRGGVNTAIDMIVDQLREANPDKEYRFVYAPPQGSSLAQVARRSAMGYRVVDLESEDDIDTPFPQKGSKAVMGDVVLMEIDKDLREEEEEYLEELASEDARRSQEAYHRHLEENTQDGRVYASPSGEVTVEERSYELDLPEG